MATKPTESIKLLLAALLLVLATPSVWAQKSDLELLREAKIEDPRGDREVPYGIEPGRKTLSPLYHGASSALWLWENLVAPEVCAPGGYTDSNTAYFKELVVEYGALAAVVYGFDRMVRNTKIGRATAITNPQGLIEDDPKKYRKHKE